jgi:tetratricopeptide (TPR) repeat protein
LLAKDFVAADELVDGELRKFPEDVWLRAQQADIRLYQNDFEAALRLYTELQERAAGIGSAFYSNILLSRLICQIQTNDIAGVEVQLDCYLSSGASIAEKINVLDAIASATLMMENPSALNEAERWARKALELAPGVLTIKGTLGSILSELNRDTEAEPLLEECYRRSPQPHDQGIAALYLGLIRHRRGEIKDAKKLIDRSVILHPEDWVIKRSGKILSAG